MSNAVTRPVLLSLVQSLVLTRLDYGNATLAGLSGRLTSVCSARRCSAVLLQTEVRAHNATAHGSALVVIPERIQFKLAVLVFSCLHGTAPPYLADQLQPVVALESRRRLRSSASARLDIPRARRTTIGERAYVAGPRVWNSLSSSTQSAPSLLVFRRLLKCELFHPCYDLC